MVRSTTPLDPLMLPRLPGWGLWGAWVLATTLAATLGLLLAAPSEAQHSSDRLLFWVWDLFFFLGPVIGLGQGLVLWGYLRRSAWRKWLAACWLGTGVAMVLALIGSAFTFGPLFGTWTGFIFGLAQYGVLRRYVPQPGLWPIANGGAWLGAVLAYVLVGGLFAGLDQRTYSFLPHDDHVYWVVGWMAGALVYGVITGLALVWMLRQPVAAPARHKTAPLQPIELFDP